MLWKDQSAPVRTKERSDSRCVADFNGQAIPLRSLCVRVWLNWCAEGHSGKARVNILVVVAAHELCCLYMEHWFVQAYRKIPSYDIFFSFMQLVEADMMIVKLTIINLLIKSCNIPLGSNSDCS